MNTTQKILIFFLLPMIAPLLLPPTSLSSATIAIILVLILFGMLGFLLLRGYSQALTLSIFLQGMNAIIRIMTFFQHATYNDGTANLMFIITSSLSIALSVYLVLRMDETDVRTLMVR